MDLVTKKAIELCNNKFEYFSDENFMMNADDERYNKYLDEVLLKYVDDKEEFLTHIVEYKKNTLWTHNGVKMLNNGVLYASVPKRKNMIDEMTSIYTITKLVHAFSKDHTLNPNITDDVVPHFNVYEYLKEYKNQAFAKLYIASLRADAINFSKRIYVDDKKTVAPLIYAYMLLEKRSNDYNINKLNKINAKSKNLSKSLTMNGYKL